MNCKEFFRLLEERPDPESLAREEPAVQEHLASCRKCRELHLFEIRMRKAGEVARADVPADLWRQVSARIASSPQRSSLAETLAFSLFRPRPVAAAAVAVSAVVTLLFFASVQLPFLPRGDVSRSGSSSIDELKSGMTISLTTPAIQFDEEMLLLQMHERTSEFGDSLVGYFEGGWGYDTQMVSSRITDVPI